MNKSKREKFYIKNKNKNKKLIEIAKHKFYLKKTKIIKSRKYPPHIRIVCF